MAHIGLDERRDRIHQMFSRVALRYDFINRIISCGRVGAWRRLAARLTQPANLVLDVATGTGELAFTLAGGGRRVVALDFCKDMMVLGQRKLAQNGPKAKVSFCLGDALALPFAEGAFDGVTVGFATRNVIDIRRALAEMRRVVKPGGRVVCLELTRSTSWVLAQAHRLYIQGLVPFLGGWLSQRRDYAYLFASLSHFPTAPQLKEIMEEVGFCQVRYQYLSLGAVAIHMGVKGADVC